MEAEVSDNLGPDNPIPAHLSIIRETIDFSKQRPSRPIAPISPGSLILIVLCPTTLNLFRADSVQVLILCEWPKATFDPHEVLRGFTFLRKLMIANSNLTRLSTAFPVELEFLEVEDTCQALEKQSSALPAD
jgi:hypothetical protein